MNKKAILIIIAVLCSVVIFAKCNHADNSGDQLKLQKLLSIHKLLDKPINYWGKVVDQQNIPISNANVKIQIGQATGVNTKIFTTDNSGVFEVSAISGSDFLITEINASGYELLDSNHDKVGYENDGSTAIDRNNPVIFTMRKKEPPTVVVEGDISVVFAKDVKYYDVDLIEKIDEEPYDLQRYHGSYAHADIRTRVEYSADTDAYTFILETPDSGSGIIELNQSLYVPPDTGYKTPYKIVVPKGQQKKTFLYVKSRGGQVYSKLDIKFAPAVKDDKIYWAAKAHTNPIGERNLDFDEAKYFEYNKQKLANRKKMGP